MRSPWPPPLVLVALLPALAAGGRSRPPAPPRAAAAPQIAWYPARPVQGALLLVGVRDSAAREDSVIAVRGELGGQPLHFEWLNGWFRAVGGVPLSSTGRLGGLVVTERAGGGSDTLAITVPVLRRRVRRERLRVPPRFVQPAESLATRLRAERELVRSLESGAHATPRLWQEPFARPVPGAIIDGFGVARVFNGAVRSRHLGVDFAAPMGEPIKASNRGVVRYVGDLYFSGNTVFLDHGAGLVSAYLHLSRALVAVGDTVARGQVIGRVGDTGRATGPHLHWLASYGGLSVDPLALLGLSLTRPLAAAP